MENFVKIEILLKKSKFYSKYRNFGLNGKFCQNRIFTQKIKILGQKNTKNQKVLPPN